MKSGLKLMQLTFAALLAVTVLKSQAALTNNPVLVDRVHVDICVPYLNGQWQPYIRADLTSGSRSLWPYEALFIADSTALMPRPADPAFDFIGMAAGKPIWFMSQNGDIGLYLGFEASLNFQRNQSMTTAHTAPWDSDGPGFLPAQEVVEISLIAVRGPGHISTWVAYAFGDIKMHMSSADGIDAADTFAQEDDLDEYPQFVGGHSHVNWAFTAPGRYEVDLQARTVLANSTEVRSAITTFYFEVLAPRISIRSSGEGAVLLTLPTRSGLTYQLETAFSLNGSWTNTGPSFLGNGQTNEVVLPTSGHQQYFRLQLQ